MIFLGTIAMGNDLFAAHNSPSFFTGENKNCSNCVVPTESKRNDKAVSLFPKLNLVQIGQLMKHSCHYFAPLHTSNADFLGC